MWQNSLILSLMYLLHHSAAPHHYAVLGSPGLSSVLGLWSGALRCTSWAPRCQPAATLPAGHCHGSEGGKRCCQAHHAFTPLFLRHYCFRPHHQGNAEQESARSIKPIKINVKRFLEMYLMHTSVVIDVTFWLLNKIVVVAVTWDFELRYNPMFSLPAPHPRSQQHAWFCELPNIWKRASALYHEAHGG